MMVMMMMMISITHSVGHAAVVYVSIYVSIFDWEFALFDGLSSSSTIILITCNILHKIHRYTSLLLFLLPGNALGSKFFT